MDKALSLSPFCPLVGSEFTKVPLVLEFVAWLPIGPFTRSNLRCSCGSADQVKGKVNDTHQNAPRNILMT